ncbi:MAG: AAA family ATPase [Meiothermus sp.]|nr:AAA family ATPase [Meiothermus sp.]
MEALRVENLRSLEDTGFIDLKPITLFLGKNSSGKSSFLRCMPLFRQSVEAQTTGPILWNGRFVDFGSFSEAVRLNNKKGYIGFSFRCTLSHQNKRNRVWFGKSGYGVGDIPVELSIKVCSDDNLDSSQISEIGIRLFGEHYVHLTLNTSDSVSSFSVNNTAIPISNKRWIPRTQRYGMIPVIFGTERDVQELIMSPINRLLLRELIDEVKQHAHRNTKDQTLISLVLGLKVNSSSAMLHQMKNSSDWPDSLRERIKSWTVESEAFVRIRDFIIASALPEILIRLDDYLVETATGSRYVAPVRATAERFYRVQNLAVDEVDFQGQNLALFMRNLTQNELRDFQYWMKTNFDVFPDVSSAGGHISLFLTEIGSEKKYNLADTGFGYSQVLPILTQLWSLVSQGAQAGKQRPQVLTLTIEQPELHLHPMMQAQLADAFIKAVETARHANINLRLMIETHSETFVNRIGNRIAKGDFSSKDVNVILFEKKNPYDATKIRSSGFDREGYLENWPVGFFEPRDL